MIANFLLSVLAGFLAPRRSARAVMDAGGGFAAVALMIVLAYLLEQIMLIATPGTENLRQGGALDYHVSGLIGAFAALFILAGLGLLIGIVAGGKATWIELQLAVAWHSVVTSFLTPPIARMFAIVKAEAARSGANAPPVRVELGLTLPLAMAAFMLWVWLLAQYIAEAHRLRNAMGVLGILMIGGLVLVAVSLRGITLPG